MEPMAITMQAPPKVRNAEKPKIAEVLVGIVVATAWMPSFNEMAAREFRVV